MSTNSETSGMRKRPTQPGLKGYSTVAGALLAVGTGAEAANIVFSGPIGGGEFGATFGSLFLVMEGVDSEFRFAGDGTKGFFVVSSVSEAHGKVSVDYFSYPVVNPVLANSTSAVGPATNTPHFNLGYFYSNLGGNGTWDDDGESHLFAISFERESDSARLYGWAEVQRIDELNGRLLRWAYDADGDPIKVGAIPEPGAMSLFALGAAGLAAFRRRRSEP